METQQKKILLIDDEEFLLYAMKRQLEKHGYNVATANNSNDAFREMQENHPDLIMLDVMMPGVNGIDFLNLISSQFMLHKTSVILMSALQKDDVLNNMGYKSGAVGFLHKPFDISELYPLVSHILQNDNSAAA